MAATMSGNGDGICFLCMEPASLACTECEAEACSREHLDIHRPEDYCFPFRIRYREEVSVAEKERYVEAKQM